MSKKVFLLVLSISLLSASCGPFSQPAAAGIVKTVNGGADWQFSNAVRGNEKVSLQPLSISSMATDPSNREVLYASSYTEGLYKSEDSGTTWTKILSKILVYDFVIHPQDSKKIYVAGFYGANGLVLVTKDNGGTWDEIYSEESPENPVRAIALNPSNPNQVIIGTSSGNVIKSIDEGVNWRVAVNLNDRINRIFWRNGYIYVLMRGKGLVRMQETTSQVEELTTALAQSDPNTFAQAPIDEKVSAFSQMFIDASNVNLMYITTNRGLYKTFDGGRNWVYVQLPVKPEVAYARAVAISRTSSNVVYTSVGSTIYKSVDAGTSWQTQKIPTSGFINYILVDPQLPQVAYAGVFVE